MQLVDVPFGDEWIVSVPEDWLVWQPRNYETAEEAAEAFIELYQTVDPDFVAEISDFTPFLENTNFTMLLPEPLNDEVILFSSFNLFTKSDMASFGGIAPDDVNAEFLQTQLYRNAISEIVELNGREALVTSNPLLSRESS